jgi:hypothetical protein
VAAVSCELKHVPQCCVALKCFVGRCVSFVCNYCLLEFLKVGTNPAAVWYNSNPIIHGNNSMFLLCLQLLLLRFVLDYFIIHKINSMRSLGRIWFFPPYKIVLDLKSTCETVNKSLSTGFTYTQNGRKPRTLRPLVHEQV